MPVILPEERMDDWLYRRERPADELKSMLVPASDELLISTLVSGRVNSVRNDDPGCLSPPDPAS